MNIFFSLCKFIALRDSPTRSLTFSPSYLIFRKISPGSDSDTPGSQAPRGLIVIPQGVKLPGVRDQRESLMTPGSQQPYTVVLYVHTGT